MNFLLIYLLSLSAHFSYSSETLTYVFPNSKKVAIIEDSTRSIRVSANCEKEKSYSCEAYTALKKGSFSKISRLELMGGVNPGAYLCKRQLGGELLIGRDSKGNESSFCHFQKDDSYVGSGTVFKFAVDNDRNSKKH